MDGCLPLPIGLNRGERMSHHRLDVPLVGLGIDHNLLARPGHPQPYPLWARVRLGRPCSLPVFVGARRKARPENERGGNSPEGHRLRSKRALFRGGSYETIRAGSLIVPHDTVDVCDRRVLQVNSNNRIQR